MKSNIKFLTFITIFSLSVLCGCSKERSFEHKNIRRLSAIKSVVSTEIDTDCVGFLNALRDKNGEKIKFYSEEYGISSDAVDVDFEKMWVDSWGSNYRFTWSRDYSLILISSDGPNREFDAYNGDDIVFVIERKP